MSISECHGWRQSLQGDIPAFCTPRECGIAVEPKSPPGRPLTYYGGILTNEELKRVWTAADGDTFGKIVKLLILTGQRVGEITNLTGRMVGDNAITLPPWLTKNNREHTFPLASAAIAILNPPQPRDVYYFPALGKTTPFNGHSACKRRLDTHCGVSEWTLHDLRRTFASGLASIGVSLPVIERLLNHVSGSFAGIVGMYQRYDFLPEMQDAIARWDEHLQCLVHSNKEQHYAIKSAARKILRRIDKRNKPSMMSACTV